jgi:hypothetical protein
MYEPYRQWYPVNCGSTSSYRIGGHWVKCLSTLDEKWTGQVSTDCFLGVFMSSSLPFCGVIMFALLGIALINLVKVQLLPSISIAALQMLLHEG